MRIDGYTNSGGVQVTLTEADVSDLVLGLAAALYRGGQGAFGGESGWTGEYAQQLQRLHDQLEGSLRPRART